KAAPDAARPSYLCPLPLWERVAAEVQSKRMGEGSNPSPIRIRRESLNALSHKGRGHIDYGRVRGEKAYAAFFSISACHFPSAARLFILARCAKARWPAATFSALPDHAFCGAACNARP